MQLDGLHHRMQLHDQLLVHQTPLHRLEVMAEQILNLRGRVAARNVHRNPEAVPLHLLEGGVLDWPHRVDHVLEYVLEECDMLGVGLLVRIID